MSLNQISLISQYAIWFAYIDDDKAADKYIKMVKSHMADHGMDDSYAKDMIRSIGQRKFKSAQRLLKLYKDEEKNVVHAKN